jgi:threonyl-tRNA synthetase
MKIWDIVDKLYTTFHFSLRVRLSFHDPNAFEKHIGTKEVWEKAENALREIATERAADFEEAPGEAALYGPKLDFMATDSLGREHQVATIQLDMNLPERFDLSCTNEAGEKERVVMIHSAIMGSLERFIAVMLEHLGGVLPLWLAPEQVRILPIAEAHNVPAYALRDELAAAGVRAEAQANDSLGKRVRAAKQAKVPYLIVMGDSEIADNTVKLEKRDGTSRTVPRAELVALLRDEIEGRW